MNLSPREVSESFIRLINAMSRKLDASAQNRKELVLSMHKDEIVHGHRLEWVSTASRAVFDSLIKTAQEFNVRHPADRISVRDMLDVLADAKDRLSKK